MTWLLKFVVCLLSALVITVLTVGAAVAQPPTYLPWQAGVSHYVIQGNNGGYSHNTAYTRYGWDFDLSSGTPVLSSASGRVAIASYGYNGGWGNTVTVCYGDGTCSRYGHLSSLAVGSGQQVGQGQLVGYSGTTGNSTGPHLHYQLENGSGASLPSSFIEAGVPGQGAWVISRNTGGTYHVRLDAQFPMDSAGVVRIAQGDGPKVPIGFNLRNDGTRTWGDVRLVLVNDPPENLRRATGWETVSQIPGNNQRVDPGGATYVRFLVNPEELNEPGDYPFRFRLYDRASGEWVPGADPSFVLRIEPACYHAAFAGQMVSPLTAPGTVGRFSLALRNAGTCTWKRGEVNLGTNQDEPFPYADGSWTGADRNRVMMTETEVPPGGIAHFSANIAPPVSADPTFRKQYVAPVVDGKQWFSQYLKVYLPIYIGDADRLPFAATDYQASWVRQTYVDGPMLHGGTAEVSVTYRNDGPAVLFAAGSRSVHLRGTHSPDRQSGFLNPEDPRTVSGTQGVKMDQTRVDPGQEFSFTLPIKVADGVPIGSYQEYFRPVAEGLTWFARDDVFWPFTVQ